jgi:alpha-tubulin suppressor-like RCC1 family protein
VGNESDWQSVIGLDSDALVMLTKTDGSIWARGFNYQNRLSNRVELGSEIAELKQILSIYNVKKIQFTGETGFALTHDNLIYSWGTNRLSDIGATKN